MNVIDDLEVKAKNNLVNEILDRAGGFLDKNQLLEMNTVLRECFINYEVFQDKDYIIGGDYESANKNILDLFCHNKTMEEATPRTVRYYHTTITMFLEYIDCHLYEVKTDKIIEYLEYKRDTRGWNDSTLDNHRRVLSSFFNFCLDEKYIKYNPIRKIKKMDKNNTIVRDVFDDLEIETLRESLSHKRIKTEYEKIRNIRNHVIFELLLSTGITVTECVNINKQDLDLDNSTVRISKNDGSVRVCSFNSKAKYYLKKLLEFESSKYVSKNNPALIVNYNNGARMGINGVERMMKKLGRGCGVDANPHKFRTTFAVRLIREEVPIEEIQAMMGHKLIDTTKEYVLLA